MTNDTPPRNNIGDIPIAGDLAGKPPTGLAAITPRQGPTAPPPARTIKSPPRRRWGRWLALAMAVGMLLYTLAGYLLVPYLFHTALPELASRRTGREIAIGGASFNPFTLTLTLRNAIVGPDPNGPADQADPLLTCGWIEADFAAISLISLQFNAQRLHINELFLHVQRFADNTINLVSLLPAKAPGEAGRYGFAPLPLPFSLGNITVANSRVILEDRKNSRTYTIEQMRLGLPYLANRRAGNGLLDRLADKLTSRAGSETQFIRPAFSATINGSPVQLTGETRLTEAGTETSLNLALHALNLADFWSALPVGTQLVMDKGMADIDLRLIFTTSRDKDPTLGLQGTVRLHDLWLRNQQGQEVAKVPRATLVGDVSPLTREYHLNEMILEQPTLHLERDPDGLWSPAIGVAPQPGEVTTIFEVNRFKVIDGRVSVVDRQVAGGFAMIWSEIQCTAESLSLTQKTGKIALTARTGERGALSLQGDLSLSPLTASGMLVFKDFDLQSLTPYVALVDGYSLRGGRMESMETEFRWQQGPGDKNNLAFTEINVRGRGLAIDRQGQALLELPQFAINKGALLVTERRLDFGELQTNRARLLLAWNVDEALPWGLPLPGKGSGWRTRVSAINMQESQFILRRNDPAPPVELNVTEVMLTSAGLEILGQTGTPDPSLTYDLRLHAIGVNLPALSPFLEADLGYPIKGGSLELTSNFHREQDSVTADNTLTITNLQLGDPVATPSRLPLTVALLTDEHGVINTNIPVMGRMDDPAFSMRHGLMKGIRNLLIRTTASPFSLLASLAPDQPVQDYVLFPFGRSILAPENEKTLQDLADTLNKRPMLRLVIKGFADASEEKLPDQESELVVDDKALATLARQRADEVQRYFVETLGVGKERLRETDDTGLRQKDGVGRSGNRVQFSLDSMTPQADR